MDIGRRVEKTIDFLGAAPLIGSGVGAVRIAISGTVGIVSILASGVLKVCGKDNLANKAMLLSRLSVMHAGLGCTELVPGLGLRVHRAISGNGNTSFSFLKNHNENFRFAF